MGLEAGSAAVEEEKEDEERTISYLAKDAGLPVEKALEEEDTSEASVLPAQSPNPDWPLDQTKRVVPKRGLCPWDTHSKVDIQMGRRPTAAAWGIENAHPRRSEVDGPFLVELVS